MDDVKDGDHFRKSSIPQLQLSLGGKGRVGMRQSSSGDKLSQQK